MAGQFQLHQNARTGLFAPKQFFFANNQVARPELRPLSRAISFVYRHIGDAALARFAARRVPAAFRAYKTPCVKAKFWFTRSTRPASFLATLRLQFP